MVRGFRPSAEAVAVVGHAVAADRDDRHLVLRVERLRDVVGVVQDRAFRIAAIWKASVDYVIPARSTSPSNLWMERCERPPLVDQHVVGEVMQVELAARLRASG